MTLSIGKGKQQYNTSLESKNGTYTVGMTRAQAEKNDSYKAMFGIDYKDLDKDQNGILSQEEILQGRVEAAKRDRNELYATAAVVGTAGTVAGIIETVASFGFGAIAGGVTMGAGLSVGALNVKIGMDGVRDAEQELENYYNDPMAQLTDARRKRNIDSNY